MISTSNNFSSLLTIAIVTLALCSCASSKVIQYLDEGSDFKEYHTFKIINFKTDNKEYSNEGNAFVDSVETYIANEMQAKGYVPDNKSDLLVRYELISGVESEVNYNNSNYYRNPGRGYYSPFYDPYFYGPSSSRHIEGILLLEIKERKTRKLVWQGSLDLKYSKKSSDNNLELLKNTLLKIFKTYPYEAGSDKPVIQKD
ncbi:DUF4136 domain-containing protein [Reichenbachiella sp. MALMAid0571]|uniref:DUF4136 domain-containing protein n=1 Tax=Reichenbachiella sp. MALMAid0571 TaxID=3143939 RepID=UPI0032DEB1D9